MKKMETQPNISKIWHGLVLLIRVCKSIPLLWINVCSGVVISAAVYHYKVWRCAFITLLSIINIISGRQAIKTASHSHSQQANNLKTTSYQRQCDVMTSHRRRYDVVLTSCCCWDCFLFLCPSPTSWSKAPTWRQKRRSSNNNAIWCTSTSTLHLYEFLRDKRLSVVCHKQF